MLVEEAGHGEASLLVQGLTEDDNLLEEEDSPLLHPGQETSVRVGHQEGVLQEEPALGYNLPLWRREKETGWGVSFGIRTTFSLHRNQFQMLCYLSNVA